MADILARILPCLHLDYSSMFWDAKKGENGLDTGTLLCRKVYDKQSRQVDKQTKATYTRCCNLSMAPFWAADFLLRFHVISSDRKSFPAPVHH